MTIKIYCKKCKYVEEYHHRHYCNNSKNFEIEESSLYYEFKKIQGLCSDINKNNDCKFFKEKQPNALKTLIAKIKLRL